MSLLEQERLFRLRNFAELEVDFESFLRSNAAQKTLLSVFELFYHSMRRVVEAVVDFYFRKHHTDLPQVPLYIIDINHTLI